MPADAVKSAYNGGPICGLPAEPSAARRGLALPELNASMDPNDLSIAAAAYRDAFGHAVPTEVQRLFALRPGPLVMEIRQAIALQRPVPGWRALSRNSDATTTISANPPGA